jgi:hypothetical protein
LGAPRRLFTSHQGRDIRWRWRSTRRGSGGQTTDGAIVRGAGLEETLDQRSPLRCLRRGRLKREPAKTPKQREKEEKEEHEQKE